MLRQLQLLHILLLLQFHYLHAIQYFIIQVAQYSQLDLPDNVFVLDAGLDFATAVEVVELVHPVCIMFRVMHDH